MRRPITFDHEQARGRTDVVLAHLGHRLVQLSLSLLRAEVWGTGHHLHRVAVRHADPAIGGPVAIAHGRLVITRASGHRLHEQVVAAGLRLSSGSRAVRLNVGETEAAFGHSAMARGTVAGPLVDQLLPRLVAASGQLRAALQARAGERARDLTATLVRRAAEERGHVEATLSELAATIRAEAFGEGSDQLQLITGLELDAGDRRQVERDRAALRERLDAIPGEIEAEQAANRPPLRRADAPPLPRCDHAPGAVARPGLMARPSIQRVHAEWLSLVETSGPFLTVPTLKRALPSGLEAAPDALPRLRLAHAEWRADPSLRQRFIRWVLDEVLELGVVEATEADPSHRVGEHSVTLRPDLVVRDRSGGRPVLLVHIAPEGAALDRPLPGADWAASPIDRAALLSRASEVPLALVTNGDRRTLVCAPGNASTGTCTWRAELWLEEPVTLRAFATLLGARRFFNLPAAEGLGALLAESADKQQEVTDRLGTQVRHAVELLVATIDRQDRERHGELLLHVADEEVYRGAVTVMMQLVFLFVAEERRLLPIDDPIYAETLAASTIRAQLQEQADRDTEDRLERSTAAWHRVLALFRAVHGGIEHDALRLPAYRIRALGSVAACSLAIALDLEAVA